MVKYRYLSILFLIILFLFQLSFIDTNTTNYYWDEVVYLHLADNLHNNLGYNSSIGESFRPPLVPGILSITSNQLAQHIIFSLILTLSLYLLYLFVSKIYTEREGFISLIMFSTLPLTLFWGSKLLTEGLSLLLIISSLYLFHKYTKSQNQKYFYLASIISALAFMTRPTNIALILSFALYLIIKQKGHTFKNKHNYIAIILFLITLLPWFYLNIKYFQNPIGMLLIQKDLTIETTNYLFYFENLFSNLSLILFFFIYSLFSIKNNLKKIPIIYIFTALYLFLITILIAHNTQNRFFLLVIPTITIIAIQGYKKLRKQFQSHKFLIDLIIITIAILNLISAQELITNDQANTKFLIDTTKELTNYPEEKIFCNSLPYCLYFGNKESYELPENATALEKLKKQEGINLVLTDNYHNPINYINHLEENATKIFTKQKGFKHLTLYQLNEENDQ